MEFSFDIVPSQAAATLQETFEFIKSRKTVSVIAIDEFQQVRAFPEKGYSVYDRLFAYWLSRKP